MEVYLWNSSRVNEISGIRKYEDNLFNFLQKVAKNKSFDLKIYRIMRGKNKFLDSVTFSWFLKYKGSNAHATSQVLAPTIYFKRPRNLIITVLDLIPMWSIHSK